MPVARAPRRDPREFPGAERFLPASHELPVLREAVQACHGCPLYRHATQAVFGEGEPDARVMLVGEVPGDREDLEGAPFVGPAGRLLDDALAEAGIERRDVYVTNVVKHFKFTRRGKRRIHDKPDRYEIVACKPWLEEELTLVKPEILVLLGATAAQALLGSRFRVTQARGRAIPSDEAASLMAAMRGGLAVPPPRWTFATVHPSSVLRAPDPDMREEARAAFFDDLRQVGAYVREL
jgi:uracil-DNA glycosylase